MAYSRVHLSQKLSQYGLSLQSYYTNKRVQFFMPHGVDTLHCKLRLSLVNSEPRL